MSTFLIDRNRFVFDNFDGETVLINLEDGLYYSITDSGTEIIGFLEKGLCVEDVISLIGNRHENVLEIPALVQSFVDDLVSQGILTARMEPHNPHAAAEAVPAEPSNARFVAPVITRFDDMQEILLLDPIHQVSEQGWPHR